jgi:hypothetical protein
MVRSYFLWLGEGIPKGVRKGSARGPPLKDSQFIEGGRRGLYFRTGRMFREELE